MNKEFKEICVDNDIEYVYQNTSFDERNRKLYHSKMKKKRA